MSGQTITNATVEEFLEEHRQLMGQINKLLDFWNEVNQLGRGPEYEEMASGVRTLRDTLSHHFAEEELDGYLKSALDVAPQFTLIAEELQRQHAGFLRWLDSFCDQLTDCGFNSWDEVKQELDKFLQKLRKHEAEENGIVQSAFNDDVGVGD